MGLALARELVGQPGEKSTQQLFQGRHPGVFWVDWREADDDVVRLAAKALSRDDLIPVWKDGRLHVEYGGQSVAVPLQGGPGEQDLTLMILNRVLKPQFEIRHIKASEGGDTLAFMVLPSEAWAQLQTEFGEALWHALRPLSRAVRLFAPPEQSEEEVLAQMHAANPGFMAGMQFARAAFRVISVQRAAECQARAQGDAAALPVTRPLGGDLVVGYFHDMLDGAREITHGELGQYDTQPELLHALAQRYSGNAWAKFSVQEIFGFRRILGAERLSAASLALCEAYWNETCRQMGDLLVAFAQPDIVAYAPAADADAVAFLIETLDCCAGSPESLSSQLHRWDGQSWQKQPIADAQRTFRRSALWRSAEQGDVQSQFLIAERYRHMGLYAEAVAHYWRTTHQVAAAPVDSNDMFKNGSAAICNLADKYEHGLGVAQDLGKAAELYLRAAKLNNPVAQYDLGMLYRQGRGVPRDAELARLWIERSATQGFDLAQQALRELDVPHPTTNR